MPRQKRPPVGPINAIDYRLGIPAVANPRCFQPRVGGPPLLFGTDIRMTILVTLALADGPMRQKNLWKHIGKKAKTALYPLVKYGLVAMWTLGENKKFVALDPCHPAAEPLRALLLAVAENYLGFSKPKYAVDDRDAGDAPTRPLRLRDVRFTFGNHRQTLALLLVHIRDEFAAVDAPRIVPYLGSQAAREAFWMFRAFGVLKSTFTTVHGHRGHGYSFDDTSPLAPHTRAVLTALDRAMPQWRIRAERQMVEPLRRGQDRHVSRRKPKRWKW